ncbi:MAG: SDR family oxidoreductase [Firmicutes bacterium]|nr:SDR family oxidoreductase [Bacillota bacterium]
MGKLDGKVAIITGSGKGIGKAYAKVFAREGAAVTVVCRTESQGLAVVEEIKAEGGKAIFVPCDVSDRAQVENVVAKTIEAFGKINALVNNAQVEPTPTPVENLTDEQIDLAFGSGFKGSLYFMQACFPYLKETKGNIINTSSGSKEQRFPHKAAYVSTKGAIEGLTKVAANEWGEYGITVNAIVPGAVTDLLLNWQKACPEEAQKYLKSMLLRRFGDAEKDVAPVAVFLASDDSKFVTSEIVYCDGANSSR